MKNKLNDYPNASKFFEEQRPRIFRKVDKIEILESCYSLLSMQLMYVAKIYLSYRIFGVKFQEEEVRTVFMPVSRAYCDEMEKNISEEIEIELSKISVHYVYVDAKYEN